MTSGLDIGARSVKISVLSHRGLHSEVLASAVVPIQGRRDIRDARVALRESWVRVLAESNLSAEDVDCIASTGVPERRVVRAGHFYPYSSHAVAQGARLLFPAATIAMDVGTNHIRCDLLSDLSNGPRYAVAPREPGYGDEPLDGLGHRAAALLDSLAVDGKAVVTGGIVRDAAFVHGLWSGLLACGSRVSLLISPEAVFAGAYGAAILAARRFRRLSRPFVPVVAAPSDARIRGRGDRSLN